MKFKMFAVLILALSSLSAFALTSDDCCQSGAKCCAACCGTSCCQSGSSCCPGDCCDKK